MNILLAVLIAFGATSGEPTVAETARALSSLKSAGFDAYMIYPRSGLEYEYMSDEWLEYVEGVVREAERIGIGIWLYDEFNWPSGSCKGRVPKESQDWAYAEYQIERQIDGPFVWSVRRDLAFGANNYSLEAMNRFRALTHEKYELRLKRYFGKTIRGIMTDEPAHYSLARRREVAARRKETGRLVDNFRWWKECESDYAEATGGRNFRRDVESWYRGDERQDPWKIYTAALGRRFISAHFEPTRAWCERNGLEFTGHLIAEQNPIVSAENNGLPVEVLSSLSLPGMDEIYSHADGRMEWLTFHLMENAARKNGRGGLVELFAMGPCDMTWEHMLKMIRLAAIHGADRYLLSLHQLNALGYTDPSKWWAMFVSPTQPWFAEFKTFAAEADRLATFARKKPRFDVAVRYPEREYGTAARRRARGEKADVPSLGYLLRDLELAGFATLLVGESEKTDLPVVSSLDEARRVAHPSGHPGFLSRHYADGTELVFEFPSSENDRNAARITTDNSVGTTVAIPDDAWQISGDRPILTRLRFDTNGVARIFLTTNESVSLVSRRLKSSVTRFSIDGSPMSPASLPAMSNSARLNFLPYAYRELYEIGDEIKLAAGGHEIRLVGGRDDCFYLPAVWMVRAFRPDLVDDFAGRLTYRARLPVPEKAECLRLNVGGGVTRVSIDGQDLGVRGWSPFEWKIPAEARGRTVEVCVMILTSIRPVFGAEHVSGAYPVGKLDEHFEKVRLYKAKWEL